MKNFCTLTFAFFGGFSVAGVAVFFAVLTGSVFALTLGPYPQVLSMAAAPAVWLCAALAGLLSLEAVWHRPMTDGRIDVLLLSGHAPLMVAAALTLAHWLAAGLPLVLAALPLGLMLNVQGPALLAATLVPGTLYLSLLGSLGALLTQGARQPGVLMVVIVLPLMVPMILLGLMAVLRGGLVTGAANPYLLLQTALVLLALPLFPLAAAHLLRLQFFR